MTPLRRGFVRIPTHLFDQLLAIRFSATEARIVLWVIRKTLGWNRLSAEFTWYKIAIDLQLDRAGVLRAGKSLLAREILIITEGQIGVEGVNVPILASGPANGDVSHRWLRTTLTTVTESGDKRHLFTVGR